MCFYDQINYNIVNYDYIYNEQISSEDNCQYNSRLSNVNLENDASWAEANQVLLSSRIILSPVILVDDILELADENDEYEDMRPTSKRTKYSIRLYFNILHKNCPYI